MFWHWDQRKSSWNRKLYFIFVLIPQKRVFLQKSPDFMPMCIFTTIQNKKQLKFKYLAK